MSHNRPAPWSLPEPDPHDDRLVVIAVSTLLMFFLAVAAVGIAAAIMP